jgi:hypothetical protein
MKPLKLKMIRTYQSVQFNKKEHTIFIAGDKRADKEFKDLELWLIGDKVFLRHNRLKLEKIIFTTNVSDIQAEELGLLERALEEAEAEESQLLQVEVVEDNTYQGMGNID